MLKLSPRQKEQISLEVVSSDARLDLTRVLRARIKNEDPSIQLVRQNAIINLANTVLNRPIYVLEPDNWGDYMPAEHGWHNGEFELILRRPGTLQLIETLGDLISSEWLSCEEINEILINCNCSIRFYEEENDSIQKFFEQENDSIKIKLVELPDIVQDLPPDQNANIRKLIERMDRALQDNDWSLVLHVSASVFETLAKLVVPLNVVENQSLGSFFSAYRKHSTLATPMLDYIESIYKKRNVEPLAGHGSTKDSSITQEEAVTVSTFTRTLVHLERELANIQMPTIKSKKK